MYEETSLLVRRKTSLSGVYFYEASNITYFNKESRSLIITLPIMPVLTSLTLTAQFQPSAESEPEQPQATEASVNPD